MGDGLMCSEDARVRDIALPKIMRKQVCKIASRMYWGKNSKNYIYVPNGDLGDNTFLLMGC